jgi:hypothetical protein
MGLLFIPQVIYKYGEPWWNNTDRVKPMSFERNLSQYLFVHHKSHINLPGPEARPPQSEAGD